MAKRIYTRHYSDDVIRDTKEYVKWYRELHGDFIAEMNTDEIDRCIQFCSSDQEIKDTRGTISGQWFKDIQDCAKDYITYLMNAESKFYRDAMRRKRELLTPTEVVFTLDERNIIPFEAFEENFEGQYVLFRPGRLKNTYDSFKYQLFGPVYGKGCDNTGKYGGRGIFGTFCWDGDHMGKWYREDFIGVASPATIALWKSLYGDPLRTTDWDRFEEGYRLAHPEE